MKECFKENEDLVRNISSILIEINKILESVGAQVDIVYEMKFVSIWHTTSKESYYRLMKHLIIKYIKDSTASCRSDGRTEEVLKQLYVLCANEEYDSGNNDASYAKYPRSANKLSPYVKEVRV